MNTQADANAPIPAIPLAVIGIGSLFPKAADKSTFWANIKNKVDAITDVPETHWRLSDHYDPDPKRADHTYGKRGGFLDAVDFNPLEFNIQPNILEAIDTSQLLGLIAAREALRDAGYDPAGDFARERVSVLLGVTGALEMVIPLGARLGYPIWKKALLDSGVPADVADEVVERISASYVPWQENSFPGLLGNVVAGRISKQFNLGGSNSVVDAACGSSLSAVHMAAMELACGHADMVITGGIDTFNDIFMYTCFSKTPALSPTNRVCPFDESSDGTLIGEGLGLITLKRLEDAERDGDHIYAVIKSVGSGSDGKGGAIYEPSIKGQVRTLRNAQKLAGVEPRDIGLIEAHGTGTKVGDATEIKALREVFGESDGTPWCALGSVKSQIGHAKAAAGAAGLIKSILALHTKVLPPTINVEKPQEIITSGNTPFYVNTETRPWVVSDNKPRRAGVSAFGFGGSNFHCILEEYRHQKRFNDWDGVSQILAWSGTSAAELKADIETTLGKLPHQVGSEYLRKLGADTRAGFDPNAPQRLCCCIDDTAKARDILEQACALVGGDKEQVSTPNGIYYSAIEPVAVTSAKAAVLFPGQGAQYPFMLRDLACHAPEMLEELERADTTLSLEHGKKLSNLIYPHSVFSQEEKDAAAANLQATPHAQPAIGAVSFGAWRYLQRYGLEAQAFAGHSYGELTALCAAHCYTPSELYQLSHLRGTLMRGDGSDKGTMLAVSASLAEIEELIAREDLDLVIANKNTPQQGVLSGARAEIERAAAACKKSGMRSIPLDVAAAFHSSLVAEASAPFRTELEQIEISAPEAQVYANKSGSVYPPEAEKIRTLLSDQIASPVEFVRQIEQMHTDGINIFVEIGPGARLSGMVKKILPQDVHIVTLDASNGKRHGMSDVARCLGQLAVLGLPLDLKRWDEDYARTCLENKEDKDKKPRMSISICGANYVKEREPVPPSSRTLIDRSEVEAQMKDARASSPQPQAGNPQSNIGGESLSSNPSDSAQHAPAPASGSVQMLRAQMSILQKMQEDTARLHEQFLAGQTQALQNMRSLMGQPHEQAAQATQRAASHQEMSTPSSAYTQSAPAQEVSPPDSVTSTPSDPGASDIPTHGARTETGHDIAEELLSIVAEKTGYPQEMLELDMSLDADLGIDSIKRVEILSAVQEQLPHLPSVEPQQLSALQTLRQIVDTLSSAAAEVAPQADTPPSTASTPDIDIASELLEIVAEKTGYPQEMLELDMSLDADLGIDSIKRVEILSAVQEQLPHLPSVEPQQLSALQTLRQIVDTLSSAADIETSNDEPEATDSTSTGRYVSGRPGIKRQIIRTLEVEASRSSLQIKDPIWIVDDASSLSEGVARELEKSGYQTKIISPATSEMPQRLGGLVIPAPEMGTDSNFLRDAFTLLQRCAPALHAGAGDADAVFITISRLDGSFAFSEGSPLHDPISGGLAGLSKTAGHEWQDITCRALDLDPLMPMHDQIERVIYEISHAGPAEVGISRSGLSSLVLKDSSLPAGAQHLSLKRDDVVIISGGGRGVTAEVALQLAQATQPTLLLLGRSPLPDTEEPWLQSATSEAEIKQALLKHATTKMSPKEISTQCDAILNQRELRRNIARMENAGSRVIYEALDIRDAEGVNTVVAKARVHGPIRGVIHGAGVLADKSIEDKTIQQFDLVYSTKIEGLQALLHACGDDNLDFIALFSSSTGRFGRSGQIDYAVANEVLNKTAQALARRHDGCRVLSLNWGPWDGGMVNAGLKKLFASEGIEVIDLEAGSRYLLHELAAGGSDVELVILGSHKNGTPDQQTPPPATRLPQSVLQIPVSCRHIPALRDHVFNARAVVPMALSAEWLALGAMHNFPGMSFYGFEHLRVVNGIILTQDSEQDIELRCGQMEPDQEEPGSYRVPMQVCDAVSGQIYSSAEVVLADSLPANSPAPLPLDVSGKNQEEHKSIYADKRLFHGPAFQGLDQVLGQDRSGIKAMAHQIGTPADWMQSPLRHTWLSAPPLLDCSFQLMILWSNAMKQMGSLPSYIRRYRQYTASTGTDQVEIRCLVNACNGATLKADIDFILPEHNRVFARIEGYECTMAENLDSAFARTSLE
jgi:acyl transferase domain-containing protein/NAD(P)-dependent dehydrogenase (short-subunit alcohol dehydrogenase family)